MRFDDNADFRQSKVFSYRDWTQENANEVEAAKYNLNYIALDGIPYLTILRTKELCF